MDGRQIERDTVEPKIIRKRKDRQMHRQKKREKMASVKEFYEGAWPSVAARVVSLWPPEDKGQLMAKGRDVTRKENGKRKRKKMRNCCALFGYVMQGT